MSTTTIHRMRCGCEFLEELACDGDLRPRLDTCSAHGDVLFGERRRLESRAASEHERAERLKEELALARAGDRIAIMQERGEVTAEVRADFVHGMTALLAGWFKDKGGVNNVELRAFHPDLGPFTMTVQRQGKQSPAEQRDEARQVAASLLRGCRTARRAVLGIHKDGTPAVNIDDVLDLVSAFHDWHARLSPALQELVEK